MTSHELQEGLGPRPESDRLAALASYRVLDTAPEPEFDELTKLAAEIFQAPISLISLVDEDRQWFKARVGLDGEETPRSESFCAQALKLSPGEVLVVEDATRHPRFRTYPAVTSDPHVRFYAGAVLTDPEGFNLGTLCVVDTKPRPAPSAHQRLQLQALASLAVARLTHRRDARRLAETQRLLSMTEALSGVGHWSADLGARRLAWSPEVFRILGWPETKAEPRIEAWLSVVHPEDRVLLSDAFASLAEGETPTVEFRIVRGDGAERTCLLRATPETNPAGAVTGYFGVLEDVTEQRADFERLRASQARYKLLTSSIADTVTRLTLEGVGQYITPAVEELLGLTPAEMAGRHVLDQVHPDDRWLVGMRMERLVQEEQANVRHRLIRKDGAPVWVETRFRLVRAADGAPDHMVAVTRDISAQKRLEDQLQASEARARKIVSNAHQAIVTTDGAGLITSWNRYAERTFGQASGEVLGRSLAEVIIPEAYREAHRAGMARFVATGAGELVNRRIEVQAQDRDGVIFPIELALSAEHGPDGWQFTAFMHDISERKAQMEVFETAFTHASIGMVLVAPSGHFIKVNDAFCDLVGYSADDLLACDFQAITHPEDLGADLALLKRLTAGEIPSYGMDKRYIRRDGGEVWVNLSVAAVRETDGSVRHFVAQVQDLTARVQAQAALEQQTLELAAMTTQLASARDAAEAANKAKGEFLANMSHELRTPLNGVVGYSRLLAESAALNSEDRQRANIVREAGESLNSLINDVLDYSKLEARAVELEARPFAVSDLVSEALAIVAPKAAEKGLALAITGDDLGVLIGDKYRLRQVLLNFLSNAVKFTARGRVTVEVQAGERDGGEQRFRLCVIDEGVGVAPEKQALLFNRFSQADTTITRTFGGTGLGLAISRELIDLMGGQVGVKSTPGQGATFWCELTLPAGHAPVAKAAERHAQGKALFPGRRVLVADDVEINRELCRVLLAQHGCETELAEDGEVARRLAAATRFDLILMDVHMPVLDGLAATRAIRATGDATPIIALTASGTPEQVAQCLDAGMNGHLLKPMSPGDLEAALAKAFEGAALQADLEAEVVAADEEAAARESVLAAFGPEQTLQFAKLAQAQFNGRLQGEDRRDLKAEAHKIAGSAGLIGLLGLSASARALESACDAGGDFAPDLVQARAQLAKAQQVLGDWIADLAPQSDRRAHG